MANLSTYKCGLSCGTEGERNEYSSDTGKGVTCESGDDKEERERDDGIPTPVITQNPKPTFLSASNCPVYILKILKTP
jgi:hypothetical protein